MLSLANRTGADQAANLEEKFFERFHKYFHKGGG